MTGFMTETARRAGELAMEFFNGIRPNEVHSKETANDMVSTADAMVENFIFSSVRKSFPEYGFYGEESGKTSEEAEFCWIVDPIDGTQSFIKGHPYFSISIALAHRGESVAGVVYAPALGRLFTAEKGRGAFLNGKPLRVSSCERMADAACATGFGCVRSKLKRNNLPVFEKIVPKIRDIKRCGSAALELCHVGSGTYDAYWEYALKPYDVAAGALVAREAGAVVCDMAGGSDFPARGILAANSKLIPQFLPFTRLF